MKCSAHVKSKKFNNSSDSDWQLLHDIMPAGFTWGGMAVPRSHKAMRKFLRRGAREVADGRTSPTSTVRSAMPTGLSACLLAEREDAKYTTMVARAQHFYLATRPPPPAADSDDSHASARPIGLDCEALVLLDGPGIRKVAVLMAPVHMSSANAADLGVDAPELLVAGIHARSQDVRIKCKCKCKLLVAGIHARSQDGRPPPATAPSAVADAVVAGCCEEVALDIAQWQTSSPGQQWAASLVVSRVRTAGIEEDEIDTRKRVTRGRPDAKVRKLMAASSTAQPPGVVKTLTDGKKRKRPVKKRRGMKLTVAESEAEAEAEAARSSKRRVPRARKNKNKQ
eukprot:jgi/Tetstr1/423703/TSEL_014337.t1